MPNQQITDQSSISQLCRVIAKQTGASTTTVTRVAKFLNQEPFGGYRSVLSKFYPKKKTK